MSTTNSKIPTPNPALNGILNKIATDPKVKEEAAALGVVINEDDEEVFHVFESSRPGIRFVTIEGFTINFSGHKYITQNASAINYLDQCIKDGITTVRRAASVKKMDLDESPANVRKKYFLEFLATQKDLLDPNRDMGSTGSKTIKVASSNDTPK